MLKKISSPNPFRTFYIVFTYIIAFTMWWAYLLYAKNETAFREKIELNEIRFHQLNGTADYTLTDEFIQAEAKYKRQKFMILSEGMAFMILMIIGLMRVRKVFSQEIELAEQQKNFMLSITHELKSPLSSIKLSLQTFQKRKLEPEQTERLIHNSLGDIERLDSLVDNILFAAKIEQTEAGFTNSQTDVSELTERAIERFTSNKKTIAIETNIQSGVSLNIDALAFISVVNNLIDNAIKYSEEGTRIVVKLTGEGDKVILSIADNGIGISDELKEKIFAKFFRIGSEETRTTKGTGLGLYIVKKVVEIYKGEIAVTDNLPKGTVFTVSFPVSNTDLS